MYFVLGLLGTYLRPWLGLKVKRLIQVAIKNGESEMAFQRVNNLAD